MNAIPLMEQVCIYFKKSTSRFRWIYMFCLNSVCLKLKAFMSLSNINFAMTLTPKQGVSSCRFVNISKTVLTILFKVCVFYMKASSEINLKSCYYFRLKSMPNCFYLLKLYTIFSDKILFISAKKLLKTAAVRSIMRPK